MKIAMYKAKHGNWLDWLIAACTWSKYSHCELILSDGRFLSSSPRDGGVRFAEINENSGHWDVFDIKFHKWDEDAIIRWGECKEGTKYDWLGAFFSLMDLDFSMNSRMFCSEFCALALGLRPSRPPSRLLQALKDKGMIVNG